MILYLFSVICLFFLCMFFAWNSVNYPWSVNSNSEESELYSKQHYFSISNFFASLTKTLQALIQIQWPVKLMRAKILDRCAVGTNDYAIRTWFDTGVVTWFLNQCYQMLPDLNENQYEEHRWIVLSNVIFILLFIFKRTGICS